jgi:hypothetical protein
MGRSSVSGVGDCRNELRPIFCSFSAPHDGDDPRRQSRNGLKIPLLISGIANIIVGLNWLIWTIPCCGFGLIFTVPMIILRILEFSLWANADQLPVGELGRRAKGLGIFEIIVGLANSPTLICGIIVLVNAGKLATLENGDH